MNLPNAELAKVEREKITKYLLNPAHRHSASKARFFSSFGFRPEAWDVLAAALRELGQQNDVTRKKDTPFGPRYEIEGVLPAPDGREPRNRSVWQFDEGEVAPRLITAYLSKHEHPRA